MKNALIATLLFSACATRPIPTSTPCNPGLALVNAALWAQSSAEYRASTMQTYANARKALDAALATGGDQPPAIVLDLDETAIQNSAFEARMIRQGKTYDVDAWSRWVSESAATPIAGAAEFLSYARSRGVTPFYVTNRKAEEEAATRRNLETLGYPLDPSVDTVLTKGERPEWSSSDKSPRRDYVASQYRLLLLLGDDLNDFVNAQGMDEQQRLDLMRQNGGKWGTSWFILPNPIYGSWEAAMTGTGSPCEQLKKKVEALTP
jgi:5'-nucleotidase (lipoprotein e(P4) family)